MKKLFIVFLVIGLALLIGARFVGNSAYEFTRNAVKASGTVVELQLVESKRSRNRNNSYVYYPVVTFTTAEGQTVTFRSRAGTNPPAYDKGETVEVLYLSDNPQNAQIKHWVSQWLLPTIILALGLINVLFGAIGLWVIHRNKKRLLNVKEQGEVVLAKFDQVERNTSLKVNGRSPYRIACQWFDPMEPSKVYLFRSENIWFNPEPYITKEQMTVYIDRKNPKKYHYVDISFLPEIA